MLYWQLREQDVDNPYQSPEQDDVVQEAAQSADIRRLRSIARSQRVICYFVLYYLIMLGALMAAPPPEAAGLLGIGFLLLAVLALVHVIMLAFKVAHPAAAVLFVILVFVPLVGLLILLALNNRATKQIRAAGFRVGLLGARDAQFRVR